MELLIIWYSRHENLFRIVFFFVALWLRLSVTLEEPLPLPRNIQVYVWNLIVCSTPLSFYELPTARPKLVIFDRFEYIDPESGTVVDPVSRKTDRKFVQICRYCTA